MNELRIAVFRISCESNFDNFVESANAYIKLLQKRVESSKSNCTKSTRLYGHLAVSIWVITTQFSIYKQKLKILPDHLLYTMAEFMALHLNLLIQCGATEQHYVNRFKKLILCVLKFKYEYVIIAFIKASTTAAFEKSTVIFALLKKIIWHIVQFDRDLSKKHCLWILGRYLFLKLCENEFKFGNKDTILLMGDLMEHAKYNQWLFKVYERVDNNCNAMIEVFLKFASHSGLWVQPRSLIGVIPNHIIAKKDTKRSVEFIVIEDDGFSFKSALRETSLTQYRHISLDFDEEKSAIQEQWEMSQMSHSREHFMNNGLPNEDDLRSLAEEYGVLPVDNVVTDTDTVPLPLPPLSGILFDDVHHQEHNFNADCEFLDKVICHILDGFHPEDDFDQSDQVVPNTVKFGSQRIYPIAIGEFTIDSDKFHKWFSDLRMPYFISLVTRCRTVVFHDSITTINQPFKIHVLDFCREQDPEKQFVRMNYLTNTLQDSASHSNQDYNGYVLHSVPVNNEIPSSPTAINSEPFLLGINEPIHDEDFDQSPATNRSLHSLVTNSGSFYNGQLSPHTPHHEQPIVDYTHKKLRQRRASNRFSPKNACSWVCPNTNTKTFTFVVDVEIMTNRELLETQVKSHSTVNKKRGRPFATVSESGSIIRRPKKYRKIDGFWVRNDSKDFSLELPWDSQKYRKRIKEYPKPGPLSSKPMSNVLTRNRSRQFKRISSTSQPAPDSTTVTATATAKTTFDTHSGATRTNMATSSPLYNGDIFDFNDSSDFELDENGVNGDDEVDEDEISEEKVSIDEIEQAEQNNLTLPNDNHTNNDSDDIFRSGQSVRYQHNENGSSRRRRINKLQRVCRTLNFYKPEVLISRKTDRKSNLRSRNKKTVTIGDNSCHKSLTELQEKLRPRPRSKTLVNLQIQQNHHPMQTRNTRKRLIVEGESQVQIMSEKVISQRDNCNGVENQVISEADFVMSECGTSEEDEVPLAQMKRIKDRRKWGAKEHGEHKQVEVEDEQEQILSSATPKKFFQLTSEGKLIALNGMENGKVITKRTSKGLVESNGILYETDAMV